VNGALSFVKIIASVDDKRTILGLFLRLGEMNALSGKLKRGVFRRESGKKLIYTAILYAGRETGAMVGTSLRLEAGLRLQTRARLPARARLLEHRVFNGRCMRSVATLALPVIIIFTSVKLCLLNVCEYSDFSYSSVIRTTMMYACGRFRSCVASCFYHNLTYILL
jgi:hypothetical protein